MLIALIVAAAMIAVFASGYLMGDAAGYRRGHEQGYRDAIDLNGWRG